MAVECAVRLIQTVYTVPVGEERDQPKPILMNCTGDLVSFQISYPGTDMFAMSKPSFDLKLIFYVHRRSRTRSDRRTITTYQSRQRAPE